MKWVRSNIRLGSRGAIFALAIQFVWSFGHFHHGLFKAAPGSSDEMRSGVHEPSDSLAGVVTPDRASHANASGQFPLQSPSGHAPAGEPTDDCAICVIIAATNAATLASAPDIPSP